MDEAKIQIPETSRQEVLQDLQSTELEMQLSLKALRDNSPARARILRNERYVIRQSQAVNPDSILSQRLLESQREFFVSFARHPRNLTLYQRMQQSDPSVWSGSKVSRNMSRNHWPQLLSMRRVMLALWLNHSILLQRTHADLAQPTLNAARELMQTLDADPKQQKRLTSPARPARLSSDSDLPFHLKVRRQHGYEPMLTEPGADASLVLHPSGGIFIGKPRHPFVDIDMALVNPDPETFPDPSVPAKVLMTDTGIHALFYTDLGKQEREVGYDKTSDGFGFIE